jgi:hypothetical protein
MTYVSFCLHSIPPHYITLPSLGLFFLNYIHTHICLHIYMMYDKLGSAYEVEHVVFFCVQVI